jgi:hypothetical protein
MYQGLWAILSLAFVEYTSIYMSEIHRNAYPIYSVPIFALFNISSILIINLTWLSFKQVVIIRIPRFLSVNTQLRVLEIFFWLVLILLYFNLFLSPIPLFDAGKIEGFYSRMNFWEKSRLPFLRVFGEIAGILNVITGIFLIKNVKKSIFMFLTYATYVVLIGHKFGTLVMLSFFLFLPYVLYNNISRIPIKRNNILIAMTVICLLLMITYLNYSNVNPFRHVVGIDTPLLAVLYRALALQSQLIWVTIEQHFYLQIPTSLGIDDILYGMHSLMNKYSMGFVDVGNYSGGTLTNGYPSILIEIFPLHIGLAVNCIFCIIFATWTFVIRELIKTNNFIVYMLSYFIFNQIVSSLTMGYAIKLILPTILLFAVFAFVKLRKISIIKI